MRLRVLLFLLTLLLGVKANAQILKFSDMELVHSVSPGPYSIGDTITYRITIKNLGPDDNPLVTMFFYGNGVRFFEDPKTIYHFSGGTPQNESLRALTSITWSYAPRVFPAGDSAVYTVRGIIIWPQFVTYYFNTYTLGANIDLNLKNNSIERSLCATPPKPGAIRGNTSLCINSTRNVLEVDEHEHISRYKWVLPEGWEITSGFETNRIEFTTNGVQADWEIKLYSINFCGDSREYSAYKVTTVAVPPPMPKSITGSSEVCAGQQGLSYSIEKVPGAIAYTWTLPDGWAIVEGAGTNAIKVNAGSASGTIKVTADNGCGGSANRDLEVLVSPSTPAAPARINGDAIVCATAGTVTYKVDAVPNARNYQWTTSAGWSIISGQGTTEIVVRPAAGAGVITVQAQNACGVSQSVSLNVQGINEAPVLGEITGNASLCASGAAHVYSVKEVLGIKEYRWSVPAGWSIVSGQGTREIRVTAGAGNGEVSVTAVGVCNTEAKASLRVEVNSKVPDSPSAIKGVAIPCIGKEGVVYSIDAVAGATEYTWNVPSGWVISSGQGTNSISVVVGKNAGRVTVFAENACGISTTVFLSVSPTSLAPAVPTVQGETFPCIGKEATFVATGSDFVSSYDWELPNGWSFISGQGTNTVKVLVGTVAGEIRVRASNGCGVSEAGVLSVTPSNGVPIANFELKGPQTLCAGNTASVTYTIEGAVQGASEYLWKVPSGWTILSAQGTTLTVRPGSSSGNVTLTAKNGCGLSSEKSLAVVVSSGLAAAPASINGLNFVCAQSEATFSVAAVNGALSYQWSFPSSWTVVSGQGTTTLVVKVGASGVVSVKANNGCGDGPAVSKTVTVLTSALAAGAISGETKLCAANAEQVFSVAAVQGATAYQWAVPNDWVILSGQNTRSVRVKVGSAGVIRVKINSACGVGPEQTLAVTFSLQQPATPSAITFTGNGTNPCAGQGEIIYSVAAVTGADEYVWTVPSGWTINSGQGTREISVKPGRTTGQISVFTKNNCGQSAAVTLSVTPSDGIPTTPTTIIGEAAPCVGRQEVYAVKDSVKGYGYNWTLPNGWSFVKGQGSPKITVVVGTAAGSIKVRPNNSCGTSAEAAYSVAPNNGVPVFSSNITGPDALCANAGPNVQYTVAAASGATSYRWEVPAGWTIVSGQGSLSISVRPGSTAGAVRVSAVNSCGQSSSQQIAVAMSSNAPAKPGDISGSADICANATQTYSIAAVSGASEYVWEVPTGWSIISGQGSTSIVVKAGQSTAQVRVSAKNSCGTSAASFKEINMSLGAPAQVGPISGDKAFCVSDQARTYSVPEAAGTKDYIWTVPAGWSILSGQRSREIRVKPGNAGGYIKVVAGNYCSTTADSTLVSVSTTAEIALGAIKGEQNPCQEIGGIEYSVDPIAGVDKYTWSLPSDWSITSGQGTNKIVVRTGKASGNISVYASNACVTSKTVTFSAAPNLTGPVVPASIIGTASVCAGSQETYQVENPVAGITYRWELPAGWAVVSGSGSSSIVVKVGSTPGTISVKAENNCGVSEAKTKSVSISTGVPVLSAVKGAGAICEGSVQTYSIDPIAGYVSCQWSLPAGWTIVSGHNTLTIQVKAGANSGEVAVTAVNGCGASAKKALAVTVNPGTLAAPGAIAGEMVLCATSTQAKYSVSPVAGATGYEWKLPTGWTIVNGEGTSSITVKPGSAAGRVSVLAKNDCSRSNESGVDVQISNSVPDAVGEITGPAEVCSNTTVTYAIGAVTGAGSYEWTYPTNWEYVSGQGTTTITLKAVSTGTVRVVAKNACGNSSSAGTKQVQVVDGNLATPGAIQVNADHLTPCEGQNALVFNINPVAGASSYVWSFPADWKIQSGQGTTSITLTAGKLAGEVSVVAKNSCGTSAVQKVAVAPQLSKPEIAGEIVGSNAVCTNGGTVTYSISGVTGADVYKWTYPTDWTLVSGQGTTTLTVTPTSSGKLEFTATNSCGGIVSRSIDVIAVPTGPLPSMAIEGPKKFCLGNIAQEYKVASVAGVTYTWQVPTGWKVISGAGTNSVTLTAEKEGAVELKLTAVSPCGESKTSTVQVTVAPTLGDKPTIKDESTACIGYQFSVPSVPGVNYTWKIISGGSNYSIVSGQGTNLIKVKGPEDGRQVPGQVQLEISNNGCSILTDVYDIVPVPLAPKVEVPNTFSPNNDGKNDLWEIKHLLNYPANELVVINRWGSEVFRQRGYKNTWNGGGLAEGTYYYVLKVRLCEGEEVTLKGYVVLVR